MQDKIQSAIQKLEKFISEVGLTRERKTQLQDVVTELKSIKPEQVKTLKKKKKNSSEN